MNIQYIGLKKIDGPLIVLDHVKDIGFEEVAELRLSDGTERLGRVVQIYGDKAVLQVFEGYKRTFTYKYENKIYRQAYGACII